MSNEGQPFREWEMTQRKLAVGLAVAATLAVLINLVGGRSSDIWDQLQPSGVAHRLAVVRF